MSRQPEQVPTPSSDIYDKSRTNAINTFLEAVKGFLRRIGVDRAVFYSALTRMWIMLAGPVSLLLIATRFSSTVQGYYYSFTSLMMLQNLFELGFSTVIIQFTSHEWSDLRLDEKGNVSGKPEAMSRLTSLARFAILWFSVSGLVLTALMAVGGTFFFSKAQQAGVDWLAPWLALSVVTGLNLCTIPVFSFLTGCNQVGVVNHFRFWQSIAVYGAIWTAIIAGAELWTVCISTAASLLTSLLFFWWRYRRLFRSLYASRFGPPMNWFAEVWPMQWRLAVSVLCNVFTVNLPVLVLFHYHNPGVAGQMGMTLSLLTALSEVSVSWVSTRVPLFGMLIARRDFEALDRTFFELARFSAIVFATGALVVIAIVGTLDAIASPLASRLLPLSLVIPFLLSSFLSTCAAIMAHYLRAHKVEPYMILSVSSGLLNMAIVVLMGRAYGATGIGWGILALNLAFIVPTTAIFLRRREEWHRQEMLA